MVKALPAGFCLVLVLLIIAMTIGQAYAQEQDSNYLKYQDPTPPATSVLSTIAYIFTLLLAFAVVIGLAYFTSRVLGQKLGRGINNSSRVLSTVSLGANRTLQVVEVAGKVLVLGVSEHSITLLQEVTDVEEINKLRNIPSSSADSTFDQVFQRQLSSLQVMSQKFPTAFGSNRRLESEQEQEKR
jgi:flagellar protein FliO/FliZ